MSASSSSLIKSTSHLPPAGHLHLAGDNCPYCEQPIPQDRYEEVKERIRARDRERSSAVEARLQDQYARDKAAAVAEAHQQAAVTMEAERAQMAAQIAAARSEEKLLADAVMNDKLSEAARVSQETQAELQARITQIETAKAEADQNIVTIRARLDDAQRDKEAAVEHVKKQAAAREDAIREEARQQAAAASQEQLATLQQAVLTAEGNNQALHAQMDQIRVDQEAMIAKLTQDAAVQVENARQEATKAAEAGFADKLALAEQAKVEAEEKVSSASEQMATLQTQMDQIRVDKEATIAKLTQDAAVQIENARQEATKAAETGFADKLALAEQAKVEAEEKLTAVSEQMATVQQSHDELLTQRLLEQREALEKDKLEAVNKEKLSAAEEKLKLSGKVEELQRALDKKTAEELGDIAEEALFDALKDEFEGDRIERINKGLPGADIRHVVIHNGKECGTILYDSKNHNAWRNDFVTKLASDRIADKADHAILTTRKFPAGKGHLDVQEGIIIASPGRVVAVATVVRQHILQTHALRRSGEERAKKTEELYAFIVSEQFVDITNRIDAHMDALLELQEKEMRAHKSTWAKQGELYRSVQKAKAQMIDRIEVIIGTAEEPSMDSEEWERNDD